MGLLTSLGLTPPKAGASMPGPLATLPTADSRDAGPRAAPKAKVEVIEGEPGVVKVRKESLGRLRWEGHRGELAAFTDANGALVTGGPRPGWRKMATCNLFARRVLAANEDLNALERAWRSGAAAVAKGLTDGEQLAKRVKASKDAISERAKDDDKFAQVMNDYFRQVDSMGPLSDGIEKADKKYSECMHRLKSVVLDTKIQETNDEIADLREAEADLEKDRASTLKIFEKVLGLAGAIAALAVAPAAAAAITAASQGMGLAGNLLIDGAYDAKLGELDGQLKDAKNKLSGLKKSKYVEDIAAASDVLAQATIDCRTAARAFTNAVKELLRRGAPAANVSSKSKDTAVISEVVSRRSEQRARITALRTSAQQFVSLLDGVSVGVTKLRDMYAYAGDWVDDIAKADPRLARGSAWAKAAELAAVGNALQLFDWLTHASQVRGQSLAVLKTTEGDAANVAMAPFEDAMKSVEEAMSQPARSNLPRAKA